MWARFVCWWRGHAWDCALSLSAAPSSFNDYGRDKLKDAGLELNIGESLELQWCLRCRRRTWRVWNNRARAYVR